MGENYRRRRRERLEAFGSPGAQITLTDLADEYLAQWTGKDQSLSFKIRYWSENLGTKKLIEITPKMIHDTLNKYANEKAMRSDGVDADGKPKMKSINRVRAPATINRMKAALSSMLKYANQKFYITSNPAHKVANRPENNKRVRYLSHDERGALLTACKGAQWNKLELLVVMALTTGARQGELLSLTWTDIDFKAKTATLLETKNGESRVLTLPSPALKLLRQHQEVSKRLVFPSEIKPFRPFEFRKHWIKALADASITDFKFHDLRHSAASYLVMNGATLYETGEVLGHKSVQTTKRYAHLSTDHKADLDGTRLW